MEDEPTNISYNTKIETNIDLEQNPIPVPIPPEIDNDNKLNWIQKIRIKKELKRIKKELKKEQEKIQQNNQQIRNNMITIINEMNPYITIIEEECECKTQNCKEEGTGHKKTEREANKADLARKTTQELIETVEQIIEETTKNL